MVAEKAQIGEREGEEMTNEKMSQKKERLSGSQGQGLCEFLLVLKLRPCRSPPPPYLPDCFCHVPLPVNGAPEMASVQRSFLGGSALACAFALLVWLSSASPQSFLSLSF